MIKVDIVEQLQRLTDAEREIFFEMVHAQPELFKKLLPGTELIDHLVHNPYGIDHPLVSHFQRWKAERSE